MAIISVFIAAMTKEKLLAFVTIHSWLQAWQDCFVLVYYLGAMWKTWKMTLLGLDHAFVMPFLLRVALLWRQQLQSLMVSLIQEHHFSSLRVYFLLGGCVAFTLVRSGNPYRRNITWRYMLNFISNWISRQLWKWNDIYRFTEKYRFCLLQMCNIESIRC